MRMAGRRERVRHPWWLEQTSATRGRRTRWAIALGIVFVACVAVHWTAPASLARPLRLLDQHAGLVALVVSVVALQLGRARATRLTHTLLHGWWRTAPVDGGSVARVVGVMCVRDIGTVLACVAAFAAVGLVAGGPVASAAVAIGTAGTLGIGLGTALAWRSRHAWATVEGVRMPLLRLRLPLDPAAPHLSDWQRRQTVLLWRQGGNLRVIGMLLALTPASTSPGALAGALLLCSVSGWLGTAWQASQAVTRAARCSLSALPVEPGRLRRASVRYPCFATACAATLAAVGLLLEPALVLTVPLWLSLVLALGLRGLRSGDVQEVKR